MSDIHGSTFHLPASSQAWLFLWRENSHLLSVKCFETDKLCRSRLVEGFFFTGVDKGAVWSLGNLLYFFRLT